MAFSKSTDEDWERIWKEKFEDPFYYQRESPPMRNSCDCLREMSTVSVIVEMADGETFRIGKNHKGKTYGHSRH